MEQIVNRLPFQVAAGRWFSVVLLGILIAWAYGPALLLPESLVDEATHLINAETLWNNLAHNSLAATIRNDVSTKLRTYNPVFWFHSALLYRVTGENRAAYHGILLAQLAATTVLVLQLPRFAGFAGQSSILAGFLGALLLLLGEVPGWHGMQTIRGNWVRLHTADAPSSLLLCLHLFLILATVRATGRRAWAWAAAAAFPLLLAALLKPVSVALLAAMFASGLFLALARIPAWRPVLASAAGALVLLAGQFLAIRHVMPPSTGQSYGSGYVISLEQLKSGTVFWSKSYLQAFGPILLVVFASALFRMALSWYESRSVVSMGKGHWLTVHMVLLFGATFASYVPWTHQLPRYMMIGATCFCALVGVEMAALLASAGSLGRLPFAALVGIGVAAAVLLPLSWLTALIVIMGIAAIALKSEVRFAGVCAGIVAAGTAFFMVSGFTAAAALRDDYMDAEHVAARMVRHMETIVRQNKAFGALGPIGDERFGSMAYFLQKRTGVVPGIRDVSDPASLPQTEYLVLCPDLDPPSWWSSLTNVAPLVEFTGIATVNSPVSFWQWRGSMWQGKPRCRVPSNLKKTWALYSTADVTRALSAK